MKDTQVGDGAWPSALCLAAASAVNAVDELRTPVHLRHIAQIQPERDFQLLCHCTCSAPPHKTTQETRSHRVSSMCWQGTCRGTI
jgi:hypothetical protein